MRHSDVIRGMVVLVRDGRDLTSWPLDTPVRLDLSVIDELGQLQLHARRLGCTVRLDGLCPDLAALLDLAGLRVEVGG